MENNSIFKIPLFSWSYVGITLVFILMRYLEIINWSPLWLLSPLWVPAAIAFSIIIILYFIKISVFTIGLIIFKNFRI